MTGRNFIQRIVAYGADLLAMTVGAMLAVPFFLVMAAPFVN